MMIPFSPPRIDEKTVKAVRDVLLSGWITTGPQTKEFERKLALYCGLSHVLCVSSATSGLSLILHWFGVGEGDEVIIPAYTFCATANVVIHCGAKPIMIDVNEDFTIDPELIKRAITPRTKVIIPVDIGGLPCDYDAINNLVNDDEVKKIFEPKTVEQQQLGRILVLADAAHSFGATINGVKSGKLTDISVFSFHAVKNLTTAEGGAVCLNLPDHFDQDQIYQTLCRKSLHGQTKDALSKFKIGNWRYDVEDAGYKCNMTDIQAAIGLTELERYDKEMLPKRREIFNRYNDAFSPSPFFKIPPVKTDGKESSCHVYMLRINNITEEKRDQIIENIYIMDVAVNVHFIPLPMLTFYKNAGYRMSDFPISFKNYCCEISLPVYFSLKESEIDTVINAVIKSTTTIINKS